MTSSAATSPQKPLGGLTGHLSTPGADASRRRLPRPAEFRSMVFKTCKLPTCGKVFTPQDPIGAGTFCCRQCKEEYWRLAAEIGNRVLSGQMSITGKSQNATILDLLFDHVGMWLDRPRQRLPFVLWNSRVAELRRRGYDIRCRRVYREDIQQTEYQYKLMMGPAQRKKYDASN